VENSCLGGGRKKQATNLSNSGEHSEQSKTNSGMLNDAEMELIHRNSKPS
jgi:hypothetical protein